MARRGSGTKTSGPPPRSRNNTDIALSILITLDLILIRTRIPQSVMRMCKHRREGNLKQFHARACCTAQRYVRGYLARQKVQPTRTLTFNLTSTLHG